MTWTEDDPLTVARVESQLTSRNRAVLDFVRSSAVSDENPGSGGLGGVRASVQTSATDPTVSLQVR